jgi:hypothetical protein
VAQYGTLLAEVTLNISNRIVTPISSGVIMDFEELEEDGRRYTWVPFMSDAFRTNAEGEVDEAESSDVVELEDARTSEAMRLPPDTSSVGLYRRFQYNGRKISTRLQGYVPKCRCAQEHHPYH